MKRLIINRGQKFSSIDDRNIKTSDAVSIMCAALKVGKAKLMVDNDTTLMYLITE